MVPVDEINSREFLEECFAIGQWAKGRHWIVGGGAGCNSMQKHPEISSLAAWAGHLLVYLLRG